MNLIEIGEILEKYRKNDFMIDDLRYQLSEIQKQINNFSDLDEQIDRINLQLKSDLENDNRDFTDVNKFLNSIIESVNGLKTYIPLNKHEKYDEYFSNTYSNARTYKKAFIVLMILSLIVGIGGASLFFVFMKSAIKYLFMGCFLFFPLIIIFVMKPKMYNEIKKLAKTNINASLDEHKTYIDKITSDAEEKINRIKYIKEQELERRSHSQLPLQNEINSKIASLREQNRKMEIPVLVLQMYNSLKQRDLFISLLKTSSSNDTLINIWSSMKLQEDLNRLFNLYENRKSQE